MSAFSVRLNTERALDLLVAPFDDPPGRWTNPDDHAPPQALAAEARIAGVAAIRAPSARHAGGVNLAVLHPAALMPPPRAHSSWAFYAGDDGLLATREMGGAALRFTAAGFRTG